MVIDSLAPIAKADPATLAKVARALPQIAKVAAADRTTLDALAKLTPADLSFLVGLTQQEVDDIEQAFGAFRRFTELPPATLAALAAADPAVLARYAAAIPSDVRKAEAAMAELKAEKAKLDAAAKATQAALSPVSTDGRVAYATVTFDDATATAAQADQVVAIVAATSSPTLTVGGTGAPLDAAGTGGPDTSTGIGLLVALVVLLIAFGSLVAAALPLVVAVTGLVGGLALAFVTAAFMDVATFAPTLAAMVGLGVGIDYSLFVLNRFTQETRAGARAASGRAHGRRHRGPRRALRRLHGDHRAARHVRAAHLVLQRPRRRRRSHGAHGHVLGAVDAAGPAVAARSSHLRPAHAVGAEEGRRRRTARPGRVALGALRHAAAAGSRRPDAARARRPRRPRASGARPRAGLRRRRVRGQGLGRAHRLRPACPRASAPG